jgi:hypothetical protein
MLPTVCFEAGRLPKLNLPPARWSPCAQMNVWSRLAGDPKTRITETGRWHDTQRSPGQRAVREEGYLHLSLDFTYHECPPFHSSVPGFPRTDGILTQFWHSAKAPDLPDTTLRLDVHGVAVHTGVVRG